VNVLRRSNHRAQQGDGGQHVNGGAARAEHGAIMVAIRRTVKRKPVTFWSVAADLSSSFSRSADTTWRRNSTTSCSHVNRAQSSLIQTSEVSAFH
jgi:hypothetical protein